MQGRDGDADIRDRQVDTVRGGEGRMSGRVVLNLYTLPRVTQPASGKLLYSQRAQPVAPGSPRGWDGGGGGRGPKRDSIYVYI